MDKLFDVKEKNVIITGGMGQIGAELSVAFAKRGAKVAIYDITDKLKVERSDFAKLRTEGKIKNYIVDITQKEELSKVLSLMVKEMGIPDVLVNNAALDSPPDAPPEEVGPFETYPEKSFDKVMEVNVKGTFNACQLIGGLMAKENRGSIINISSVYGTLSPCQDIYDFRRKKGEEFFKPVAYSISKSSIMNFTRYLATYWSEKGVRVNTLTLSGIYNNQPEEFLKAYSKRIPMRRMANVEEVTGPVIYLASAASSFMTGANLVVDGGRSAW